MTLPPSRRRAHWALTIASVLRRTAWMVPFAACVAGPVRAQTELPTRFTDQLIVQGLNNPCGFAFLPDGRMLVVERAGAVRLVAEGKLGAVDPVLTMSDVSTSGDRGATGIAIDPRWPAKPYVYIYYDAADSHCEIARYTAGGDLAVSSSLYLTLDPDSRYDVLSGIPDLQDVHNGGSVRFGPDSMLYAALGDDAGVGDEEGGCAAQDSTLLRGVVIRIDVRQLPDGPGGPPDESLIAPFDNPLAASANLNERLILATGLRNPFRFHIDPVTSDLFLGDVGLTTYEEIDQLHGPMTDFGWPYYEGPAPYVASCPNVGPIPVLQAPIYAYDRTGFPASIISAGVYRGTSCPACNFPPEYEGDYFFSDFFEGFLRRLKFDGTSWQIAAPVSFQPSHTDWGRGFAEVTDYAVGPDGALWYCRMSVDFEELTGEIHRLYYTPAAADAPSGSAPALSFAMPYPSPSRGRVTLGYTLPRAGTARLTLVDAQGRAVREVAPTATQPAGLHQVSWDGCDTSGRPVPPGVYLARLDAGDAHLVRRLVICR